MLTAQSLFLAAGAVGTTELLLRSRDVHKTLPDLSPRLGEGFSGNGDYLSLIRRTRIPLDPERGPTITTTSVVDFDEADGQVWSRSRMAPTRACFLGSSAASTRLEASATVPKGKWAGPSLGCSAGAHRMHQPGA